MLPAASHWITENILFRMIAKAGSRSRQVKPAIGVDLYNLAMGISRVKPIVHWIPALLSVVMIVCESTATMSANNTSRWLYPLWVKLFGPISAPAWAEVHHLIRKTGHFVGYGVVSLTFLYGWKKSLAGARRTTRATLISAAARAVLCTVVIATLDEYHQSFLPSRTSSPIDVCIDACGAITAQLLLLGIVRTLRPSLAQS
jgi:VanZ family protein